MNIINGDIGGTKTLLQLINVDGKNHSVVAEQRFASSDYQTFDALLSEFINQHCYDTTIHSSCFGVAGPVLKQGDSDTASITNLPWQMDSTHLSVAFNLGPVRLINDFEAVGYGIELLDSSDLVTLQAGVRHSSGNQLVIGAGTGLGVAQRICYDGGYHVIPTEGGHADFAPTDHLELELARYLIDKFGRASVEYVVSGPGLENVYRFLAQRNNVLDTELHHEILASSDPSATIALYDGKDVTSTQALDLFVRCYGGQCGNYALTSMALGGVYVAGGIAPRLIERLKNGPFIHAFNQKGKMSHLTTKMPIQVIINTDVGLLGSLYVATNTKTY